MSFRGASPRLELASWHRRGPSRFLSIVFEAQPDGSRSQNFPGKHLLSQGPGWGGWCRGLGRLEGRQSCSDPSCFFFPRVGLAPSGPLSGSEGLGWRVLRHLPGLWGGRLLPQSGGDHSRDHSRPSPGWSEGHFRDWGTGGPPEFESLRLELGERRGGPKQLTPLYPRPAPPSLEPSNLT